VTRPRFFLRSWRTPDSVEALLDDLMEVRARTRPRGRPFVTLAYAQSVDGSITIARGQRYALSGPDSLRFTHLLRARHDAILVGVGTVLADDPELRVRLVDGRDPQPVIVDSRLNTPVAARLLAQQGRRPWIGTTAAAPGCDGAAEAGEDADARSRRRAGLEQRGARLVDCAARPSGWVDLPSLLHQLAEDGIDHVMVEGGARIITSFLDARLVDYAVITIAPLFLGGLSAVGPLAWPRAEAAGAPHPNLARWISGRLGEDLILSGELRWPAE
jgi:3,4-dihydroxy 2-butanone 4-phosphate synthase/GTP cyclohydrolase II